MNVFSDIPSRATGWIQVRFSLDLPVGCDAHRPVVIGIPRQRTDLGARVLRVAAPATVGMLVMGFLTWRTFTRFQYVVETAQVKPGIYFPIWPANLAVVIAFGFLALVYLLLLAKTLAVGVEQPSPEQPQ